MTVPSDRKEGARDLIERLYAPATGGNTRPLRTEAADTLAGLLAVVERYENALRRLRLAATVYRRSPSGHQAADQFDLAILQAGAALAGTEESA